MSFNRIVIMVATVLLIVSLTMIGIALRNQKKNASFPPVVSDCPDFYTVEEMIDHSGKIDYICNIKGDYVANSDGNCDIFDNGDSKYKGVGGLCQKKKWATKCKRTWDGVTNNPEADLNCY